MATGKSSAALGVQKRSEGKVIPAAEGKNAENLLIIRSKDLAQKYIDNWEKHKGHSEKNEGR